jgi:cardiolipin synthase A/B
MKVSRGRAVFKRLGLGLLIVFVLAFALIGVLSVTRGTPIRTIFAIGDSIRLPSVRDSLFARTMELYSGVRLEPNNRVEVFTNGDQTYPRVWSDLRAAQRTITVQMYFSKPGAVADSMAAVLAAKAREHVRVLLLLDAFGSSQLRGAWEQRLRAAGVEVAWLRPVHWYSLHKASQRSHARSVVVDGRVGYTGGFGLADYWLGDGRTPGHWREGNVRFEGPSVAQLQAAFAAGWAEATGELLTGDLFLPAEPLVPSDSAVAGLLYTTPAIGSTEAERFMALSIAGARLRLYVANSYFVPDDDFRRLLVFAARRGADVRILTAGDSTDVRTTLYAGRARYEELLRGGVRIYEYRPTMMHAKTLVADGIWSAVGSLNFDNRSLALNNETNLLVLDPRFGAAMEAIFLDDLRYSKEIRLEEFRQRGWVERLLETGATLLSRLL